MSERIQPALSAEQWADFLAGGGHPYEWGGAPYQVAYRRGDSITLDGSWTLPELAAKALHGRINWAMVDALRNHKFFPDGAWASDADRLVFQVADLLESLLPPRTP